MDRNTIEEQLADGVNVAQSRSAIQQALEKLKVADANVAIDFYKFLLEKLQPRSVLFKDQICVIRESLAERLQSLEQWQEAAQFLIGMIPLMDASEPEFQARIYVQIVRLLLEDDNDPASAEIYLNRASMIMPDCKDYNLQLAFKVCQARILDYKRRFLDASIRFYELSQIVPDPDEQNRALTQSIVTCCLSNATIQRTRQLNTLVKDERVEKLCDPIVRKVLNCVHSENLLDPGMMKEFRAKFLSEHHLATLSDGKTTVFDRAVIEHNMFVISKRVASVTFDELARIVGMDSKLDAEQYLAKMITEGRVSGCLDQAQDCAYFEQPNPLVAWNEKIAGVCGLVNRVYEK